MTSKLAHVGSFVDEDHDFERQKRQAPPEAFPEVPRVRLGGLPIAKLDRDQTADLILASSLERRQPGRPMIFSSANGEVISRCRRDPAERALLAQADLLSADGQPLVFASRMISGGALPERVATTDLFHDVARRATIQGASFYLHGATEAVNAEACSRVQALYPNLKIVGRSHGYHTGVALERQISVICDLAPDILWVALGFPREQEFCRVWAQRLSTVGAIKTSGGLFDFLAGARKRAPSWMQTAGLEWAFRISQEPRRLWYRYLVTNPHAAYLLLTESGAAV
jgi:N-acetylglucosaminyldiphosphoundecaprenol N-acetyl-beta-D-mannosaminyltransferase